MDRSSWAAAILVGAAAGAFGTLAMDAYWKAARKLGCGSPAEGLKRGEEPSTVKVAETALEAVGVENPPEETRRLGGKAVHWTYGTSWGIVASVCRQAGFRLDWDAGVPFGVGLWLFSDLWLLYQCGYARHPREYPLRLHANALAAHLAYSAGVWGVLEAANQLSRVELNGRAGLPLVA